MPQAQTITKTIPGRSEIRQDINWGAVVKGALIIGAVVAVAVVGYGAAAWALNPANTGAFAVEATKLFAGAGAIVTQHIIPAIQGAFSFVWTSLGNLFSLIPGVGNAAELATRAPAAVTNWAGIAVGSVGAFFAGKMALPHLMDVGNHLTQPVQHNIPTQTVTETIPQVTHGHDATTALASAKAKHELTRQMTDVPDELMSLDERRQQRNWADRSDIRRERRDVAPRQASQVAALADERANESLLSDPVRG
ncbi:MAG: hypothetical protein J0M34_02760 [Alphaproteobacteria bacterium]|nr:hypothetical protein [Alphaproteobacteria bacterium]